MHFVKKLDSQCLLPVGLTAVLLFAGYLRCINIQQSLWLDELHTAWVVSGNVDDIVDRAATGYTLATYFFLPYLSTRYFGQTEFALRLPSLIASLLLVVVVYNFAYQTTRSNLAGFGAAMLVAIEPNCIFYGQEARCYAVLQLIAMMQIAAAWQLWTRPSKGGARFIFVLCGLLLFAIHPTGVLQLVALATTYLVGLTLGHRWKQPWHQWLYDQLMLLLVLLMMGFAISQDLTRHREQWAAIVHPISMPQLFENFPLLFAFILASLAASPQYQKSADGVVIPPRTSILLLSAFVIPLAIALVATMVELAPLFHTRYVICTVAPSAVLVCWLLRQVRPPFMRLIATAVIVALLTAFYGWDFQAATNRFQDWRQAIGQINAGREPRLVYLRSGFMEAKNLEIDAAKWKPLWLSPVKSIYRIDNKPVYPLPTANAGRLTAQQATTLLAAGGAWFLVCGTPDSVEEFLEELTESMKANGLSARAKVTPYGDVSVVRVYDVVRP